MAMTQKAKVDTDARVQDLLKKFLQRVTERYNAPSPSFHWAYYRFDITESVYVNI